MDNEISKLKKRISRLEKLVKKLVNENEISVYNDPKADDITLAEAIALAKPQNSINASFLQRRLSIGYARAARILDQLEDLGLIGSAEGSKPRQVIKK